MFVELVYDKRNVQGLEGAREIILTELTKRVHRIFPESDREKLNRMLEEMFEESDMWLIQE